TFFFIALFFLPETPKFLLIARSNRPAAERSVRFYHGSDSDVDTVLKEIVMEAEDESEAVASWKSIKESSLNHISEELSYSASLPYRIQ
ncbi:hypothetical protein ANCCEY_14821, partial [Ancylostoma ceylanicum]